MSFAEPIEIKKSKIIAVEGRDDSLFFDYFLQYLGITDIQTIPLGGKSSYPDKISVLISAPNFHGVQSLGLVRDADDDPHAAFQSVCTALTLNKLPVPKAPLKTAQGITKTTVMIFPSPNLSGELEDLCLDVLSEDLAMDCVRQYFDCMKDKKLVTKDFSKAKLQVFLASRQELAKSVGEASRKGCIPFGHSRFQQTREFLVAL